jgi:phosphonate transport system substrate-binding protein
MKLPSIKRAALGLVAAALWAGAATAQEQPYAFNVINQRSVAITAQYWNPILVYVSRKSGVPLELRLAGTIREANALGEQGAFAFIYTNQFFTPERDRLGFHVIARPAGPGIRGQIAVRADSPISTVQDLHGREVAFASPDAFAGYWLPMDALLKGRIAV